MLDGDLENKNEKETLSPLDLKNLLDTIAAVRFGSVTLIIQDGKVIQIEKQEKIRLI